MYAKMTVTTTTIFNARFNLFMVQSFVLVVGSLQGDRQLHELFLLDQRRSSTRIPHKPYQPIPDREDVVFLYQFCKWLPCVSVFSC